MLMQKKVLIGFGILCGLIFVLLVIARITGMLQFYNVPTSANEPAIKPNNKVLVSNLKKPASYNYVVLTSIYADSILSSYGPYNRKEAHYLYRLCGLPGDHIKMVNGVLYVNSINFDSTLNLKKQFKISTEDFLKIEEEDVVDNEHDNQIVTEKDSALVTFENVLIKKYQLQIKFTLYLINDTSQTAGCFKWFDKNSNWTADNFGPLEIPDGMYFVLGDNRHFAMDSRYIGFIGKDDIKGVVINK
jgi:signal peptidase I